jgi:hypothetical protein
MLVVTLQGDVLFLVIGRAVAQVRSQLCDNVRARERIFF